MKFIELVKNDLEKKYSDILNGKTDNVIAGVEVKSEEPFEKYSSFKTRLKKENDQFNAGIDTIKENESRRLKKEGDDAAAKKRAEEEAAKKRAEEDRRRREAAARAAQAKRDKIERVFQTIALFGPAVLVIVTAIIMFSNATQLQIRGKFIGSIMAWIAFLIATVVATIIFAKKLYGSWEAHDKSSRIVGSVFGVLTLVISIITISVSASTIKSDFNPATFIEIKATGKTTSESYYTNYTTISFSLQNTSDIDIDSVKGNMDFYKGSSLIGQYTVTFNGTFGAGRSYTSTVEFNESSSNSPLHDTSYDNLGIKWKVTDISVGYKSYSVNGSTIQLKTGSNTNNNNNNNGNGNNNGGSSNNDNTTVLQRFKNAVSNDVILPDNYKSILDEGNINTYSYYNYQDYDGYYAMFEISEAQQSTFMDNFFNKLTSNGYSVRYDEYYEHEYIKNNTVLKFDTVQESKTYNPSTGQYTFNYYYFNFYAFTI